jgi:hypothetical protein
MPTIKASGMPRPSPTPSPTFRARLSSLFFGDVDAAAVVPLLVVEVVVGTVLLEVANVVVLVVARVELLDVDDVVADEVEVADEMDEVVDALARVILK